MRNLGGQSRDSAAEKLRYKVEVLKNLNKIKNELLSEEPDQEKLK